MEMKKVVEELLAAPSACEEAKAAGQAYPDAVGTEKQAEAAAALLQEMKEDICDIDSTIEFFASEMAAQIFGAEQAQGMGAHMKDVKAAGGKYCDCPGCTAALKIIENADQL